MFEYITLPIQAYRKGTQIWKYLEMETVESFQLSLSSLQPHTVNKHTQNKNSIIEINLQAS